MTILSRTNLPAIPADPKGLDVKIPVVLKGLRGFYSMVITRAMHRFLSKDPAAVQEYADAWANQEQAFNEQLFIEAVTSGQPWPVNYGSHINNRYEQLYHDQQLRLVVQS